MTPEREAQMRKIFEKDLDTIALKRRGEGEYLLDWVEQQWEGFLACARALEPMVRDREKYRADKANGST